MTGSDQQSGNRQVIEGTQAARKQALDSASSARYVDVVAIHLHDTTNSIGQSENLISMSGLTIQKSPDADRTRICARSIAIKYFGSQLSGLTH